LLDSTKNLSSARGFYMVSLSCCSYLLQSSTSWMDTPHWLTISCLPSVLLITIWSGINQVLTQLYNACCFSLGLKSTPLHLGSVYFLQNSKNFTRFPITSNLWHMHGVLNVVKKWPYSAGCFLAYKPAVADSLWEKNTVSRLISRADKLSRTGGITNCTVYL
jgi:uncharacterized membrane protein YhdT